MAAQLFHLTASTKFAFHRTVFPLYRKQIMLFDYPRMRQKDAGLLSNSHRPHLRTYHLHIGVELLLCLPVHIVQSNPSWWRPLYGGDPCTLHMLYLLPSCMNTLRAQVSQRRSRKDRPRFLSSVLGPRGVCLLLDHVAVGLR